MAIKNVLIVLAFLGLISNAVATRELYVKPEDNLEARLEASGGLVECWNALMEMKSCSNEIVLFFLNGETDIGPECCRAIDIVTKNCWPAMLTSLGFTAEEGNILRGYCDASSSAPALAPTATVKYQI
ncbi:egg cell-secreted protein 1.4 [Tripterygium wilfordii]|uniref:Egg cell-secreted protein 1.4 n=1 Tax=Tripterygium wilfordii TaxID=458696 RepID=A0A7J7DFQ8_TRIWF|nr:egg cell-secreted protein 1.4-like [Tripterygium wilfordii]KAF5745172.1 egg cell-secreted protein 1.4 [Tripterygium wilfordii]